MMDELGSYLSEASSGGCVTYPDAVPPHHHPHNPHQHQPQQQHHPQHHQHQHHPQHHQPHQHQQPPPPPQQQQQLEPQLVVVEPLADVGCDARCILCDSYIPGGSEPPAGVDIAGFRLPSTQETLAEKLETVVRPGCGVSVHQAAIHWQMKIICMACSAVIMTLDSYETKILEIREDIKRKFGDMMRIRAEKFGALQAQPPTTPVKCEPHEEAAGVAGEEERSSDEAELGRGTQQPGSPDSELTCPACNKRFRNKYNLKRHSTVHAGVKPFSCEYCPRTFRLKDHLKTHTRSGPTAVPLSCSPCGVTLACFTLYSEHRQQYHSDAGDNACRHCDLVFGTATELRRHCRQLHPHPARRQFRCSVCSRDFTNGFNLRRHHLTHSGERPFACDLCGKRFTQPSILKKHNRVHEKKPPVLKDLLTSM